MTSLIVIQNPIKISLPWRTPCWVIWLIGFHGVETLLPQVISPFFLQNKYEQWNSGLFFSLIYLDLNTTLFT